MSRYVFGRKKTQQQKYPSLSEQEVNSLQVNRNSKPAFWEEKVYISHIVETMKKIVH